MKKPRKICVVTGSRADYGLLYWPMKKIEEHPLFELQLVITGMHLSPIFGNTAGIIEMDGFQISGRVEMLLSGDTHVSISKSVGLGIISFAEMFEKLNPDIVMILGDRFEIMSAVQAALFAKIPVAHLCGGDVTEGAFDEAIRHSISKMAHIHFPTNSDAAKRLKKMGENPKNVHVVGSPGIDRIKRLSFLDRDSLFKKLEFKAKNKNALVVFHPTTLETGDPLSEINELIKSLDSFSEEIGLIITGSNADTTGQHINKLLSEFAERKQNTKFFMSLGSELFLNTLNQMDVIIGNSSSGLYEAPTLGVPAVNIGDRQKGRLKASSVYDCEPRKDSITNAIKNCLDIEQLSTDYPYGNGNTAEKIVEVLLEIENCDELLKKPFF